MKHQLLYGTEQLNGKDLIELPLVCKEKLKESYYSKSFSRKTENVYCFNFTHNEIHYSLKTSYFIGIDWLEKSEIAICVESKLNGEEEIDFLSMLLSAVEEAENLKHLEELFQIDFNSPWIKVPRIKDQLSPFLIVQFLSLTKNIVRKGLKKSYYRVSENLNSKIKGKILIGQQIKTNLVQQKLTYTHCEFQQYGIDHWENQFLKTVLRFIGSYLEDHRTFFSAVQLNQLSDMLRYCLPAFESVSILPKDQKLKNPVKNALYKEYSLALPLGETILKRFSYNITRTKENGLTTIPPFWIDMSKLFELYVYRELKRHFPEKDDISYHDKYLGGKETDILIKATGFKCVIDCKYKPKYEDENPSLEDKRQLAGYTRLKSVYQKLDVNHDQIVKGLIIYSHQSRDRNIKKDELLSNPIKEYIDFYKLGISLPVLQTTNTRE
jgi:5-methylcytosine-specific restriction endonuclease McrBC regulatory subunit McrC